MEENIRIASETQNPWWFKKEFETGIDRLPYYTNLKKYLKTTEEIILIQGTRRTGKSTLMYQMIKELLKKEKEESILFINLDEPLFLSHSESPSFLTSLIQEYTTEKKQKKYYIFIDEIQNYTNWHAAIKSIYDTQKNIKIIMAGSSSSLIENSAATKISGRYLYTQITPLSFEEYLKFNNIENPTIIEKKQRFQDYIRYGGFPRVVLEKDEALKQEIIKNYFQTIYLKDIIYLNNLRNNKDVFDILYFVISNISRPFSYNKIGKSLGVSTETVKEYLEYAQQAYLIFSMNKFDYSLKKQFVNPKKIYCIDTGIVNSLSFKFSENKGRLLENMVFIRLKNQKKEVYYHKEKYECDFLIKKGKR